MADIKFSCPLCGRHISCSERHRGRPLRCPHCAGDIAIPGGELPPLPPVVESTCDHCGEPRPGRSVEYWVTAEPFKGEGKVFTSFVCGRCFARQWRIGVGRFLLTALCLLGLAFLIHKVEVRYFDGPNLLKRPVDARGYTVLINDRRVEHVSKQDDELITMIIHLAGTVVLYGLIVIPLFLGGCFALDAVLWHRRTRAYLAFEAKRKQDAKTLPGRWYGVGNRLHRRTSRTVVEKLFDVLDRRSGGTPAY